MSARRLEHLVAVHELSDFRSGNDTLDSWLRDHALGAQQMDSALTFVLVEQERIVGYFSLTMGSVLRADAPRKLVRGRAACLPDRRRSTGPSSGGRHPSR